MRIACLHGLGGTGATMGPVARALVPLGHEVEAPTLPGHGTRPEDLLDSTWEAWLDAVPAADVLVGQSMGASLALASAARRASVRAVVAVNPLAPDPDAVDGLEWRLGRGASWVEGAAEPGEVAYDRLPLRALLTMAAGVLATELAAVACPVLLVTSALDDVVDPAGAELVAGLLGGPVERVLLRRSGHTATLGPELDVLVGATARFLDGLSPVSNPRR